MSEGEDEDLETILAQRFADAAEDGAVDLRFLRLDVEGASKVVEALKTYSLKGIIDNYCCNYIKGSLFHLRRCMRSIVD